MIDPYYRWLGIRDPGRPPDHYRLLGIEPFEDDADVIESAADRQMAHVRTFQSGPHASLSQQLLNELASARLTLLNADRKTAYDEALRWQLATQARAAAQVEAASPPQPAAPAVAPAVDAAPATPAAPLPPAAPQALTGPLPPSAFGASADTTSAPAASQADTPRPPSAFGPAPTTPSNLVDLPKADASWSEEPPSASRGTGNGVSFALMMKGAVTACVIVLTVITVVQWLDRPVHLPTSDGPQRRFVRVKNRDGSWGTKQAVPEEDPIDQLSLAEDLRYRGHQAGVWRLALARGGGKLLSGSTDGTVRMWQTFTGQPQLKIERPGAIVLDVAFNVDGTQAACASTTGLLVFDVATGDPIFELADLPAVVNAVAFSPADGLLAAGSDDGRVTLYSSQGEPVRQWDAVAEIYQLAFSTDGSRLVTATAEATIRVWDPTTKQQVATLVGHTSSVHAVAFSPDGKRILSGGKDGLLREWDLERAKLTAKLEAHADTIEAVAFSADGHFAASGGRDAQLRVWNLDTGKEVGRAPEQRGPVFGLVFTPDGLSLVSSCTSDTDVVLWRVRTGENQGTLPGGKQK